MPARQQLQSVRLLLPENMDVGRPLGLAFQNKRSGEEKKAQSKSQRPPLRESFAGDDAMPAEHVEIRVLLSETGELERLRTPGRLGNHYHTALAGTGQHAFSNGAWSASYELRRMATSHPPQLGASTGTNSPGRDGNKKRAFQTNTSEEQSMCCAQETASTPY